MTRDLGYAPLGVALVAALACPVPARAQDFASLAAAGQSPDDAAAPLAAPADTPADTAVSGPMLTAHSFAAIDRTPDRVRALDCMTMAIAYEAGNQPLAGQQAVGQVILNRLRVQRFPKSVCGVVFDGAERRTGCQFTFTCDGSMLNPLTDRTLLAARSVAEQVLAGAAPDRVGGATHYHADYVLPNWAGTGLRVARIGAHIFYRMPGDAAASLTGPGIASLQTAPEPEVALPAHTRARRWAQAAHPVAATAHSMFAPWGLKVADASR